MVNEVILKHLQKPSGYNSVSGDEWRDMLRVSQAYGCDWVQYMTDEHNPLLAQSVEDLCLRHEAVLTALKGTLAIIRAEQMCGNVHLNLIQANVVADALAILAAEDAK